MRQTNRSARSLVLLLALVIGLPISAPTGAIAATPTPAQLIGQKLMVAMSGTTPTAALLGRIQRGEVGGVILFGSNIQNATQLRALTTALWNAAVAGGQPPLLIATDQEGGSVKRLAWAPPTMTVSQMAAAGSATTQAQGQKTGAILACAGINNDLAPVADVPSSTSSFMYLQGRTWSFDASITAARSTAFATGLVAGGSVPAMKHFPGIGRATQNTDSHVVEITASKATLAPGLLPYQQAIAADIPMIMLSNATYSAYDASNAAGWSHAISVDLLRGQLGFTGVSITDSLTGTASARGVSAVSLAVRAAKAGTDMLLLTGSEASTASAYSVLLGDAEDGTIAASTLEASYARILALKSTLKAPTPDATAPVVKAPMSHVVAGSTLGATAAVVRTSASATDPCGISQETLERRVSGGPWTVAATGLGPSISKNEPLTFGRTYRYVVRATDGAGNTSAWSYGRWLTPLLTQQASSAVSYTGTWHGVDNPTASGGSLRYSTTAGASATFTFTGSAVSWVAARSPIRGAVRVYVDGVDRGTLSLYAPEFAPRQVVYSASWAANGPHTLRIVNLGTAGHSRVDIDAFVRISAP